MQEEIAKWKKSNSLYSVASILEIKKIFKNNIYTSEDDLSHRFPLRQENCLKFSIEMSIQGSVGISMCVEDQENLGIYLQPHFKNRKFQKQKISYSFFDRFRKETSTIERKEINQREDKHGKVEMERGSDDHEKCLINSELEKKNQ